MSEAKVKLFVNGVECEGNTFNAATPGTTIQPQFTTVCGGGGMLYPGSGINPDIPIQHVEQMVPQRAYNEMVKLWLETREENERLRNELDAMKTQDLKARLG